MAGARVLYLSTRPAPLEVAGAASDQPAFLWRMVGANNRPIGQAAVAYDDFPLCQAPVERVLQVTPLADFHLLIDLATGLWNWRLEWMNAVLAISSRAYQRQRECRYNADTFVALAPSAVIVPDVLHRTSSRVSARFSPQSRDFVSRPVPGVHLPASSR